MIPRGPAIGAYFFVVLAAMLASFLSPFSNLIELAANNVYPYPGSDIQFDYFMGGLAGLVCGLVLIVGPFPAEIRSTLIFGWAVKLAAALFIMPVYEYAYGLDLDGYYMIYDSPPAQGIYFGKGTGNIRLLTWAMFRAIGPHFHAGKVIFTFIGLMGIYFAYRGAVLHLKRESPLLLLLTILSPTGLFWSSILGKDPICLLGVGIYAHGSLGWLTQGKKAYMAEAIFGALVAAYIRSYFLPILSLPLTLAFFLQSRHLLKKMVVLPIILAALFVSVSSFQREFKLDSFDAFAKFQVDKDRAGAGWGGGSSFTLPTIDSPVMLALVAPFGAFTALFRPMIFEAHNPFALAAALDNTFLLILALYSFARSKIREFFQPEVFWMGTFVLFWSTLYGLGAGNLGAISRFKIQVLPTFITLLLFLARKRTRNAPIQNPA